MSASGFDSRDEVTHEAICWLSACMWRPLALALAAAPPAPPTECGEPRTGRGDAITRHGLGIGAATTAADDGFAASVGCEGEVGGAVEARKSRLRISTSWVSASIAGLSLAASCGAQLILWLAPFLHTF
eukprot:COSAG04_NODE_9301_length_876_cov_1.391248_2_plen_129_part_00